MTTTSPTKSLTPNAHHHNFKYSETITDRIEREEDERLSQQRDRRSNTGALPSSAESRATGHSESHITSRQGSPSPFNSTSLATSNSLKTLLFTWPEVPRGPKSAYELQQKIRYHRHDRDSPQRVNPQYRTMSGSSVSFDTFWDDPVFLDPLKSRLDQRPAPPGKVVEPDEDDWRDDASLNGEYKPSAIGVDEGVHKKEWKSDERDLYEGFVPPLEMGNKYKAYREKFEKNYSSPSSRRSASVHSPRRSNTSLTSSRRSMSRVSLHSARSIPLNDDNVGWGSFKEKAPHSPLPRPRTSSSSSRSLNQSRRFANGDIHVGHHEHNMPPLHSSPRSQTFPSNPLPRSPIQRKSSHKASPRSVRSEPVDLRPLSSASQRGKFSSTLSVRTEPADFSSSHNTTALSPQKISVHTIEFNGAPTKPSPSSTNSARRSSTSSFSNKKRYNLNPNRNADDKTSVTSLKSNYLRLRKQLPLQKRFEKPATSSHTYGWLVKQGEPFKPSSDGAGRRLPEKKSPLFMTQ
mmetsp:Transcript_10122/g.37677  ORF Transcript_10122/g.37677 Transcript_10122/m.37677 type:complete len:518 (-) Transcript_10122:244-1797(-)|eukprot:CAMPEP_0117436098 /NCGR_PEP_ID=MMETSP0759-20121206/832_1 /TAXON_ID=63605 /ORGANISM="Percolomonas cosmopolitus, Strain WS" /LENGTH=517 /DNA_ID=CAMNT_0005227687 /DNA_START=1571 /DNA_END=3124 /DNA_ORIENTATION=-